ncbi:DUF2637 domain-containing protein [Actinomadura sp. 9N407]|uniref:DUF2637 domain-containing protein n=1 Tax=Actinomadura sp. 9N407 TaxID=3375154 RepID=UPI0037A9ABBE
MKRGDRLIRWSAAVSVTVVAVIAAVISYGHAYALVIAHGETGATARALPLTVDGLIVTCSLVLLDAARCRRRAPVLAWLLLGAGIVATLGANVAHGLAHGPVGAVIAGWPALVAVGSFEMLARLIRGARTAEPPAAEVDPGPPVLEVAQAEAEHAPPVPFPAGGRGDEPLAELLATARDRFAEPLATGALPSVRALRRELRVGHPRAVAVRSALTGDRPG